MNGSPNDDDKKSEQSSNASPFQHEFLNLDNEFDREIARRKLKADAEARSLSKSKSPAQSNSPQDSVRSDLESNKNNEADVTES